MVYKDWIPSHGWTWTFALPWSFSFQWMIMINWLVSECPSVRRSFIHACHRLSLHAFIVHDHNHCHLSSLISLTFSLSLSFVPSYLLLAFLFCCRLPALWVYRDDFILEHSLPVQWAAVDYLHLFPPSLVPVDTAIDTWDARLSMGHSNCFPFSPWVTKNLRLPSINP